MEKYLYSEMSLSDIYKRLSKAKEPPSDEPSDPQPEQWIAPGGEQLRGEKARMFFLNNAYGNADYAARDHQDAIKEHNDLYLADKQPRGRAGGFIIPKEKQDGFPPSMSWNPIDGETEDEPRGSDPTFEVKKFNEKRRPATPRNGETQEQANERERDKLWQRVKDSLAAHADPFTISADPNNARQWKYHGLQNSFANQDALNNIPLHVLYNQLSKAYKTAAWQRAEGQNPKGGLNAKGRASARAEGHNLKPPVKSGDNPRRASFLARMGNSPGPEHDEHGNPTRLLLSLQAWGASSKADAKRKAKAISARLKMRKSGNDIINSFDENDLLNWRQPDFTNQYNTELNPEQESAYQKWLSIQKVSTDTRDYDLKGFFADQVFGKTDTSEHKGHFDDRWKKPNHMTFSDQSNYAEILDGASTGGRWIEHLSPKDDPNELGHYTFAMSPHQEIPEQAMREYFQREESHNSFFDPKTHVIHEGEIPLTDQHVDHLIQAGVAYPSLYGMQKVNNVRNLAPNLQTIRGVRLGSAPVIKPKSPDMPVVPPAPLPSADSTEPMKMSWFSVSIISARLKMRKSMSVLEKGRGEDARTLFNGRSADQYDEKHYPTGKMIQSRSGEIGEEGPDRWGPGYTGVFGENRHLLVEASSKIPRKTKNPSEWYAEPYDRQEHQRRIDPPIDPHIEWVHIKPGTVVEPHHIRRVFQALYDAGFTGPNLTYNAIPDPDEAQRIQTTPGKLRRDRLFRPWVKKWKEFVASQPPAPYIDTTQPAGEREDEDPWEGMKEFHEPEVDLQRELEKYSDPEIGIRAGYGQTLRRSWFSVSIRRFE